MYNKNNNEQIAFFDIDDTLVSYDVIPGVQPVIIESSPVNSVLYPLEENIKKLKEHKLRGHFIYAHSQGGVRWCESVIIALKLENYVDQVSAKPIWYWDNADANSWMTRCFATKKENEIL